MNPQVGAVGIETGDRFLLCTDGLTDAIYNDQLPDLLKVREDTAVHVVREGVARSGKDNTTAVIVEVVSSGGNGPE